jgi:predicted RNA-binding Zn-ribbon protein involved in translation (DUF1610 family)
MPHITETPVLTKCPNCGSDLALLPASAYSLSLSDDQLREIAPGDITDEANSVEARFAVMDAEGRYTCPSCDTPQTFGA